MQFGCIRAPRQTAQNGSANDDVSRYLSTPVHFHPVPPCLNWCRGGEGPRQLCSRLGINVHFPTDGRIVTTTRVMEATSLPARSCRPGLSHFPLFRGFCVALCLFHPLRRPLTFSICFVSPLFFGDALFPRALGGHLHIPHRKFEAKQYHQTLDLTLK